MRASERREQVLACAAALFAEQGYHATTIEHICGRASIARGTFYIYFQDKRAIFDELLDRYMDDLWAGIQRIDVTIGPARCLELMHGNIRSILTTCLKQRDLTKILLSQAVGLDPELDTKLIAFYDNLITLLESTLQQAQQLGLVYPGNTRIPAISVLGTIKELLYQHIMREFDVDEAALVDGLVRLFGQGLVATEWGG